MDIRKLICALLVGIMAIGSFAACTDGGKEPSGTTSVRTEAPTSELKTFPTL